MATHKKEREEKTERKKRGQDAVGTRGLLKPVGMVKKGVERILENRTTQPREKTRPRGKTGEEEKARNDRMLHVKRKLRG